ncbi:MAG: DUF4921 family protein [Planctomycetales bacterium]|nr:DUF4921 family protein [Planctomycetales bacterium]
MSEVRHDPVTGRQVIIAQDRANRPHAFVSDPPLLDDGDCPFCVGRESNTPRAIAEYAPPRPSAAEPWWIRVVPNKYPAVRELNGVAAASPTCTSTAKVNEIDRRRINGHAFFTAEAALGSHEVIIESPRHVVSVTELDESVMRTLFHVYRDRLTSLRTAGQLAYAMAFKNVRPAAGASLAHSHSQLLATPFVPPQVELELSHSQAYFADHGQCVFCELLRSECRGGVRIVAESANFVAWCPFASRCPYEVWIAPKQHACRYESTDSARLDELAALVQQLVGRLEAVHPQAAYNYLLHTAPINESRELPHYHWHIELLPRLIKFAGFEWGSGCYINPIPPETAAEQLRA